MEKKYLLPQLKVEEPVVTNNHWENQEKIYDFLLKNLKLHYEPRSSIFDHGSNSFPHMFEHMLLFHSAFLNEEEFKEDHERAVLEWRACLAIMALQRIKNVKLDMVKVDLQNSQNTFLMAASYFSPDDSPVFNLSTWDFLYILCMDNEPIALVSPVTLICPAKQFRKKISSVRWISLEKRNGKEYLQFDFRGRGREYSNLKHWLVRLEKVLRKNPEGVGIDYAFKHTMEELNAYIKWVETQGTTEYGEEIQGNIYYSMNCSLRDDYKFFNSCCDFKVANSRFEFLKKRYQDDVFQPKMFLVVYDKNPDAMFRKDNLDKMDALFQQLPYIDGERIVMVKEPGGEHLPAYVLLPFRDSFVTELIRHRIRPEEMIESCRIEYVKSVEVIDVFIQIKGFPFFFEKRYSKADWQFLYGKELPDIYIWPKCQINDEKWKAYYLFTSGNGVVQVSVPESAERSGVGRNNLYIDRSDTFPSYIKFENQSVSGYLPIRADNKAMNENGGTATVFVHIGHCMTYVEILGENSGLIKFKIPRSLRIVGTGVYEKDAGCYFIPFKSYEDVKRKSLHDRRYFKNMLHSFRKSGNNLLKAYIRPMQDGQILFDEFVLESAVKNDAVSFFNFEYFLLQEKERRDVHLFIEEILLYVAEQVVCSGYAVMKVEYLYCVENDNEKLGDLQGLWENAFNWVKKWTGIEGHIKNAIGRMNEPEALAFTLYNHLYRNNYFVDYKLKGKEAQELYIGVDIGWSKTLVSLIDIENTNNISIDLVNHYWTQIDFAGRHISMLDDDGLLKYYIEILCILLSGVNDIDKIEGLDHELLEKLSKRNSHSAEKIDGREYYLGLFDVIAMRIEDEGFRTPPDVYNKEQKFNAFISVMTYNVFLLFLNIGYVIGKICNEKKMDINAISIFLTGNGTKFLKWVSNVKTNDLVCEKDGREFFISKTGHSLPEVVKIGSSIVAPSMEKVLCKIELLSESERLIDGYIFKQSSGKADKDAPHSSVPEIKNTKMSNTFRSNDGDVFCQMMADIRKDILDIHLEKSGGDGARGKSLVTEVILNEAKTTKEGLEKEFDKIQGK